MNNFFKKTENRLKILHKSHFINPHLHWEILVKFFLFLSFLLILVSFYFLYKIKNDQMFKNPTIDTIKKPELVNNKILDTVEKSFNSKSLKSEEINNTKILFKDPS